MCEATDLAVGFRRFDKVKIGEGMRLEAPRLDAKVLEEVISNQVRRLTEHAADPEVDARLTKMDGQQLSVTVSHMQQADITELRHVVQRGRGHLCAGKAGVQRHAARRSNRQLAPCDLPQLIDQALEIAGNNFDLTESFDFKAIAIERDFDPQLGPVPATANELEQVLLNLLKNAAQAIHLRDDASEPGRITLRTRLNPPWAEVQVEDNGIGMPEPVRKRIFEPFFTTKEVGQGTGLGLSVSYFIVTNNHKGQLEVQSSQGQGTCFTLRLPLTAPSEGTGN